jgi:hypothetical protein
MSGWQHSERSCGKRWIARHAHLSVIESGGDVL